MSNVQQQRAGAIGLDSRRPVRMVCLDVDGTMLGASGTVRDAVWHAVEMARRAGIQLTMCSGRPGFGVTRELAHRVNATGWHCFQNGASIVRLHDGQSQSAVLDDDIIRRLVARARETNRLLELYTDTHYVTESETRVARVHAEVLGLPYAPQRYEALPPPIVRAQWIVPHHELNALVAEPHDGLEVSPATGPALPEHVFVNLTRRGVDKGYALRVIAAEYGVALDEVMYVGDGFNDTPALGIVGWTVAMGNAEPVAKALAAHIVADVEADGVAEALEMAIASRG
ncbi:Cof-type HAD-IIB family hydrolase [Gemmatimonas sp.]|uniref:Cof-type HAD-IIB family hydrolase n=1 Tax=Gemmatimonas sp. TaxID=1962908 RepID=UPI00391F6425